MSNLSPAANEAITKLTAKGREAMTSVGMRKVSFFDDGIVEGSGAWGETLTSDLGHKSAGVINRLGTLGLFDVTPPAEGEGAWFALTAIGAEVANHLAGTADEIEEIQELLEPVSKSVKAKKTAKTAKVQPVKIITQVDSYRDVAVAIQNFRAMAKNGSESARRFWTAKADALA
jgi:hypothetical protein